MVLVSTGGEASSGKTAGLVTLNSSAEELLLVVETFSSFSLDDGLSNNFLNNGVNEDLLDYWLFENFMNDGLLFLDVG